MKPAKKDNGLGPFFSHGKRYCECCKQMKPKPRGNTVKGWKCEDCRGAK